MDELSNNNHDDFYQIRLALWGVKETEVKLEFLAEGDHLILSTPMERYKIALMQVDEEFFDVPETFPLDLTCWIEPENIGSAIRKLRSFGMVRTVITVGGAENLVTLMGGRENDDAGVEIDVALLKKEANEGKSGHQIEIQIKFLDFLLNFLKDCDAKSIQISWGAKFPLLLAKKKNHTLDLTYIIASCITE